MKILKSRILAAFMFFAVCRTGAANITLSSGNPAQDIRFQYTGSSIEAQDLLPEGNLHTIKPETNLIDNNLINTTVIVSDGLMNSPVRKQSLTSEWGEFSCCRRGLNIKVRERSIGPQTTQYLWISCFNEYCETCENDVSDCECLKTCQGACDATSDKRFHMILHCPLTCGFCSVDTQDSNSDRRPATTQSTTTAATTSTLSTVNLAQVRVFYAAPPPYVYMYTTSQSLPTPPWRSVTFSTNEGEITSFQMYSSPVGAYNTLIYFCKARNPGTGNKWLIRKTSCTAGGWRQDFVLYASNTLQPNSQRLFIASKGSTPWTSRISTLPPCCGYTTAPWSIFVPNQAQTSTTMQLVSTTEPNDTSPNSFQVECLRYHNFFRALHNLPAFEWDSRLSVTAKRWAIHLVQSAPNDPDQPLANVQRTPNWPHSESGTSYRGTGVGENIGWDFSTGGVTAKKSVLRWYVELFDYDKTDPLRVQPNKPTGHYTQMLWRTSTRLGCSKHVGNVFQGGFSYKTSYTVAHYYPAGNIQFSRPDLTIRGYNDNVPDPRNGTCLSNKSCSNDDRCMGFDPQMSCRCQNYTYEEATRKQPICSGSGGCMARCTKPKVQPLFSRWIGECMGEQSCKCSLEPVNNVIGAICV